MKYYQYTNENGTYKISLRDTGKRDTDGKAIVSYALWRVDLPGYIFAGDSLRPSPMYEPEGPRTAAALLDFVGRHTSDLSEDELAQYDGAQKAFASYDCKHDAFSLWQERLDPEEYARDTGA